MLLVLSILALSALTFGQQCPPPGSLYFLIPHETDCTKFYICSHGHPVLQSCPDGTHFNPIFRVCQNPVFAGCTSKLPEHELECSWPDFEVFRPHPETCSKYYVCEYGVPLVFDCPPGTEFSAELKKCVWPFESNCKISNNKPVAPESPPQDGGNPPQDGGKPPQNGGCVEGALSNHKDCSKYNICNHGVEVSMDCPHRLQWSSKVKQCVWPHESDCSDISREIEDTEPLDAPEANKPAIAVCEGDVFVFGDHEDCDKYTLCHFGITIVLDCPRGLFWNSVLKACVYPHQSDCYDAESQDGSSEVQNGGSQNGGLGPCEEGALSEHADCGRYNMCSHGTLVAMDCPAGLHWNKELKICDWPASAGCA